MPQETASMESSKLAKAVHIDWQRGGLRWKISATFSGLIPVLGLLVIGIVYYFTSTALQKQVDLRSAAIATNLADAAAGLVSRKSAWSSTPWLRSTDDWTASLTLSCKTPRAKPS